MVRVEHTNKQTATLDLGDTPLFLIATFIISKLSPHAVPSAISNFSRLQWSPPVLLCPHQSCSKYAHASLWHRPCVCCPACISSRVCCPAASACYMIIIFSLPIAVSPCNALPLASHAACHVHKLRRRVSGVFSREDRQRKCVIKSTRV